MYQLISATPSPYARKVRIALAEKGLPFELLTEVPWDSTTASHTPSHSTSSLRAARWPSMSLGTKGTCGCLSSRYCRM